MMTEAWTLQQIQSGKGEKAKETETEQLMKEGKPRACGVLEVRS